MEVRSVEAIVGALNGAGVRYLIVGGLAVNAHGFERMTKDVDLVIQLESANILKGLKALEQAGYRPRVPITPEQFADAALREQWREEKHMLVLPLWSDIHRRTPVDVFVYEPFDFSAEIQRAGFQSIAQGLEAPIVSLQTLLEMKKTAGRPQDVADIEALRLLEPYRK